MKVNYYLVVYHVSPDNLFSPLFFAIAVSSDRGARRRGPAFSARGGGGAHTSQKVHGT
jgi:hypothetical protein